MRRSVLILLPILIAGSRTAEDATVALCNLDEASAITF